MIYTRNYHSVLFFNDEEGVATMIDLHVYW